MNKQLVAAIIEAGAKAVGLSGIDGCLVEAELLRPELGQVGRPVRFNAALLDCLTDARFLPVVACVAGDRQGRIYNVNADQMAVACAAGFRAERLVFLTDVDGVLGADKQLLPLLSLSESRGSYPARSRHRRDAGQAHLGRPGPARRHPAGRHRARAAPSDVLARLLSGEALGTRLVRESEIAVTRIVWCARPCSRT